MSRHELGHGYKDAIERSQEIDYGETMGKRKKPWAAKGYTFPEVQAFHQETFPVGIPGGPGGPGGPMTPVGDPCAGRVLQPLTHITVPCGDKDFPMHAYGAVGEVTIHWPEGITGNTTMGTIDKCPENEFITFWVCDECPGCSTVTVWFEACSSCGSFSISCGSDLPSALPCFGVEKCYERMAPGAAIQFTASGATGGVTWEVSGAGWTVDNTGLVTPPACGSGNSSSKLTATDGNCCVASVDMVRKYSLPVTGSSTTVKSSSQGYSVTGTYGVVTWSVTGTGATISQSGTLTTDATACGMLEVRATDECGGCGGVSVRVTNGGLWALQSSQTSNPTGYYSQCNPVCSTQTTGVPGPGWCDIISGDTLTSYSVVTICRCPSGGPNFSWTPLGYDPACLTWNPSTCCGCCLSECPGCYWSCDPPGCPPLTGITGATGIKIYKWMCP